ncbi:MAG: 50S ribosomal protein L25 [Leptospirillum sp.]|jgi:large subunit ribosomal protein L25
MQNPVVEAKVRNNSGKGVARTLRREGMIPAVLYGKGKTVSLSLTLSHVQKLFHRHAGSHAIFQIELDGVQSDKTKLALVRDIQRDPLTGRILHLDFMEISSDDLVKNKVPVEIVGEVPVGVKMGGTLDHNVRELTVECLPAVMPDHIKVDASMMNLNDSFHVRDLPVISGIRILDNPETVLLHLVPPRAEAVSAPAAGKA